MSKKNVICFESFKVKKAADELARRRFALYVSRLNGKASSSENRKTDLDDRISRIKSSLGRINNLMKDLKTLSDKF